MSKKRFSPRDVLLVVFLVLIVIGLVYYMGFYTPLMSELESLATQTATAEAQFSSASATLASMNAMKQELDEIYAMPEDQITEIAPYDNKEVVLNLLNGILAETQYSLSFAEPAIQADGTVRRNVSMSFSCESYDTAKQILEALDKCQWRCLISNLSISGSGDVLNNPVSVSATITFFESIHVLPAEGTVDEFEDEFEDEEFGMTQEQEIDILDLFISDDESALQANGTTDRAMIVTTLWRLEGKPEPAGLVTFIDVKETDWFADAVAWAAENNIIGGFENEFFPLTAISRNELNTVLFRYAAYKNIDMETLKENIRTYISEAEAEEDTAVEIENDTPAETEETVTEETETAG